MGTKHGYITEDDYKLNYSHTKGAVNFEEVNELMKSADKIDMKCEIEIKRVSSSNGFNPKRRYDVHFYTFEKVESQDGD